MLQYFIIFTLVGFFISKISKSEETAIGIIIFIAIVWAILFAPIWGLASFGEMILGYFIGKKMV